MNNILENLDFMIYKNYITSNVINHQNQIIHSIGCNQTILLSMDNEIREYCRFVVYRQYKHNNACKL